MWRIEYYRDVNYNYETRDCATYDEASQILTDDGYVRSDDDGRREIWEYPRDEYISATLEKM